jgi:D-glycerate 3-kinase
MSDHILTQLPRHRSSSSSRPAPPLFVGVQGPQGSGKTYLSSLLRKLLTAEPHNLSVVVFSVDDLYTPYTGLCETEQMNPGNRLLEGRGLPGTHDMQIGKDILSALRAINEDEAATVTLPVFEKSLHNGKGDRLTDGVLVKNPVDVVVMEGWCMGFRAIDNRELERRWSAMDVEIKDWCREDDVKVVNDKLREYIDWWQFFDVFIQVRQL